jgi:serine/threonine protein kinase
MGRFSPEQRALINDLVADALDRRPEERESFLNEQCPEGEVREEVFRLLGQAANDTQSIESMPDRGPRAGETVGRFRLMHVLGHGASGEVYMAVRFDIGQRAAVKILRSAITDPHSEKRFEQEARLLAGLDHPNIVKLLDYGHTLDDRPYLAMEHVGEGTLRKWCDQERLGVKERILLFLKVCDAVRYAHEQLLVHRDLKPENILIDLNREPKLVDFGLVRVLGLIPSLTTSTELDVEIERSVGGTYEYASPEQLVGGQITTASDVYGLGAVLYELLSGRVPLRLGESGRETAADFIHRVRTQPPPKISDVALTEKISFQRNTSVPQLRRTFNADLDAILHKALCKNPVGRYGNAKELGDDLTRYLRSEPVAARSAPIAHRILLFARRRRYILAAAAALLIATLAVGTNIWEQDRKLRADDVERSRTINRVLQAAASFERGFEGMQRSCRPDQARAADAVAQERLTADPNPDTKFHAARCRRIFAEVLLRSKDPNERKQGKEFLDKAKDLLAEIRSKDPDYGGLDGETAEVNAVEDELRSGNWTTSGVGFAAELIPPQLSAASESLDEARQERNLADLWISIGDVNRAAAEYARALASYDASGYASTEPLLKEERAECEKRWNEARNARKTIKGPGH